MGGAELEADAGGDGERWAPAGVVCVAGAEEESAACPVCVAGEGCGV